MSIFLASILLPALSCPIQSHAVTNCSPNTIVSGGAATDWLGGEGVNVCTAGDDSNNYVNNVNGVSTFSGQKWECVELVNRLYLTRGWITSTWSGNGNTLVNDVPSGLTKQNNGSISYVNPGDVITLDNGGYGHAAIINSIDGSSGELHIINQNASLNSTSSLQSGTSLGVGNAHYMPPWLGYTVQAIIHHPAGSSSGDPLLAEIDHSGAVWAEANTQGHWTNEAGSNSAAQITTGGSTQVILDDCKSIWAREGLGYGGWTQEAGCNSSQQVAASNTGVQTELDDCGAIWARQSISVGGWTKEAGCSSAKSIEIGGNTQVLINDCNAVWAKSSIGYGGWAQETNCNSAQSISVGAGGLQALVNDCGAVWAKSGVSQSGWTQETGCNSAAQVAVGNNNQVILNGSGELWARSGLGYGGWTQEAGSNSAQQIVVGSNDTQLLLSPNGAMWAKQGIGYGGWIQQAGSGSAAKITAG